MKRSKADLVRAWLIKGQKDLLFAREALKWGEEYTDMACFHSQQSAEKTLKAFLVWLEIEFPKTHVLGDLLDLIAYKDPFFHAIVCREIKEGMPEPLDGIGGLLSLQKPPCPPKPPASGPSWWA